MTFSQYFSQSDEEKMTQLMEFIKSKDDNAPVNMAECSRGFYPASAKSFRRRPEGPTGCILFQFFLSMESCPERFGIGFSHVSDSDGKSHLISRDAEDRRLLHSRITRCVDQDVTTFRQVKQIFGLCDDT